MTKPASIRSLPRRRPVRASLPVPRRSCAALGVAALLCGGALGTARGACAAVVLAVGDSITAGVTRSMPNHPPEHDREGGYAKRLEALLGGDTRVVARGAPGFGTGFWLDRSHADVDALQRLVQILWPDFRPPRAPRSDEDLLEYVVATEKPDAIVLLVGINDLTPITAASRGHDPGEIAERIHAIAEQGRKGARLVVVATLLPNRRDPQTSIDEINQRLCALEPDCLRLDRAFGEAGGLSLLGDEVHPDERGHAAVAQAFARALLERGFGAAASPARPAATP